ncbi:MAG: 3-mercaptopyruvate sulfurtransferase [Gemmatimonadales bacterium]|nr:3-mercaptopyruvate sulfurtransferase [Gemmatimonadales bacterium]
MTVPALVPPAWLAARLDDPAVVVLDGSWYLPQMGRDARAEFRAGHVPGARFVDLEAVSDAASPLPHMLPPPDVLGRVLGAAGVTPQAHVVVYDGSGAFLSAGRLWWMLRIAGLPRVSVLDGGLVAWRAAGLPLEPGEPPPASGSCPVALDRALVRDLAAMRANVATRAEQVVDARPSDRFAGAVPEPRPGLRAGHIPGAANVPFVSLVGPDARLLPPDQLAARFTAAGVDLARPITCSCGSGVSAGALALALATLGRWDVAIYDGSWAEWGGTPDVPVDTGP